MWLLSLSKHSKHYAPLCVVSVWVEVLSSCSFRQRWSRMLVSGHARRRVPTDAKEWVSGCQPWPFTSAVIGATDLFGLLLTCIQNDRPNEYFRLIHPTLKDTTIEHFRVRNFVNSKPYHFILPGQISQLTFKFLFFFHKPKTFSERTKCSTNLQCFR